MTIPRDRLPPDQPGYSGVRLTTRGFARRPATANDLARVLHFLNSITFPATQTFRNPSTDTLADGAAGIGGHLRLMMDVG